MECIGHYPTHLEQNTHFTWRQLVRYCISKSNTVEACQLPQGEVLSFHLPWTCPPTDRRSGVSSDTESKTEMHRRIAIARYIQLRQINYRYSASKNESESKD